MQVSANSATNVAKILLTGGHGRLATAFKQALPNAFTIDRADLDITNAVATAQYLKENPCNLLIHCAAYTDVAKAEIDHDACYAVNVQGTENLVRNFKGKKFVYISTDYVFDGNKGNYNEDDTPNPVNYYALTKLLGEIAVRQYPNTLIMRTSFKADGTWPYPKAFNDLWTSADYISKLAPQLLAAALDPQLFGIIHIAGSRKTIFELAQQQTPDVLPMSIKDVPTPLPHDVSLNSSRWLAHMKETATL